MVFHVFNTFFHLFNRSISRHFHVSQDDPFLLIFWPLFDPFLCHQSGSKVGDFTFFRPFLDPFLPLFYTFFDRNRLLLPRFDEPRFFPFLTENWAKTEGHRPSSPDETVCRPEPDRKRGPGVPHPYTHSCFCVGSWTGNRSEIDTHPLPPHKNGSECRGGERRDPASGRVPDSRAG